jgi:hypothetical protein
MPKACNPAATRVPHHGQQSREVISLSATGQLSMTVTHYRLPRADRRHPVPGHHPAQMVVPHQGHDQAACDQARSVRSDSKDFALSPPRPPRPQPASSRPMAGAIPAETMLPDGITTVYQAMAEMQPSPSALPEEDRDRDRPEYRMVGILPLYQLTGLYCSRQDLPSDGHELDAVAITESERIHCPPTARFAPSAEYTLRRIASAMRVHARRLSGYAHARSLDWTTSCGRFSAILPTGWPLPGSAQPLPTAASALGRIRAFGA